MLWKRITTVTLTAAMLATLSAPVAAADDKNKKDDQQDTSPKVTIELNGEGAQLRSNIARRVLGRFWIGIQATPTTPALQSQLGITGGVTVVHALEGHAAAEAGIQKHDVITRVNDTDVANIAEFMKAVEDNGEKKATLTVYRGGKKTSVAVTPTDRPEESVRLPFDPDAEEFKEHSDRIGQWLESFGQDGDFEKLRMFRFGPGIVIDEEIAIDGEEFNPGDLEKRVREAIRKRFEERAERSAEAAPAKSAPSENESTELDEVRRELKQLRKDLDSLKKNNTKKETK